jgi:hypothetical protein
MSTEGTMSEISLADILPKVTEGVVEELRKRAVERFEWQMSQAVEAEVKRYIAVEIMPSLSADLAEHHTAIKAAIVAGVTGACMDVAEAIRASMTKKLSGYDGEKLLGQILAPIVPKQY